MPSPVCVFALLLVLLGGAPLTARADEATAGKELATLERDYLATLVRHDEHAYAEQRRLLDAIADLRTSAAQIALRGLLWEHGTAGDRIRTLGLLRALVRHGSPTDLDEAIRYVERARDELLLESLASVLAAVKEPAARTHLTETALRRATPSVKAQIIIALGAIGDAQAMDALIPLLRSENLRVKIEAMNALGLLKVPGVLPNIAIIGKSHDDPRVRRAAARSIGMIGTEKAIPHLLKMLDDPNTRVVEAAAQGLGLVGLPAAVPALIKGLERYVESDLRLADAFASALHRISGKPLGLDVELWRSWWEIMRGQPFERLEDQVGGGTVAGVRYYGFPVRSSHVVFVLDISRSMGWNQRLRTAKTELEKTISKLPRSTMFNVLVYSDGVQAWKPELTQAKPSAVKSAIAYVKRQKPENATNSYGALARAFQDPKVDTIFFLTDGHPTAGGLIDPDLILASVRSMNRYRDVRVHGIALTRGEPPAAFVGTEDRETSASFMKRLAEQNGGNFEEIR